jgi:hypothetical protein
LAVLQRVRLDIARVAQGVRAHVDAHRRPARQVLRVEGQDIPVYLRTQAEEEAGEQAEESALEERLKLKWVVLVVEQEGSKIHVAFEEDKLRAHLILQRFAKHPIFAFI